MAKTTEPNKIVIIDDELHNMWWMVDYLESKKFEVETADTLNEGLNFILSGIYRALIIDLNIPVMPPVDADVKKRGNLYIKYPGLYLAFQARNRGYRDRQVIIYSVHRDQGVSEEVKRLYCTYILKGRPKEIKQEIDFVVQYDPTT
ncbi:MAG: hypothetical protein GVY13_11745 [Alphaproteobacteria bacterium]|nr:hypothetical protein [Alphaproteobacteria bacterium]